MSSTPMPSAGAIPTGTPRGRRHRWKVLGVGVAANASFSAAFSGIPTTAVLMRSDYHLDNAALGLAMGLLGLGIAVSELPWGLLTDRWGDRRVLLLGLGATAAALALMALFAAPNAGHAPGVGRLAIGMLVVGLLGGSVNGSSGRAVMAWFHEGERGLAMSIRQTAVPLGGGLGALILPTLAATHGFVAVYGGLAALCAVTALFAGRWLHAPPATDAAPFSSAIARGPLRNSEVWRVAAAIGLLCVPQIAVLTFGTIFLHDVGQVGIAMTSGTLVAVQVGAGVLRVWSGRWTDRHQNRRAYMRGCSLASSALFLVLALLARTGAGAPSQATLGAIVGLLALGGICASAWHGVAFTELATLAGAGRAGTALALGNSFAFMTLFVTPLVIPIVLETGSWPIVWLGAGGCALLALPVFPRPVSADQTGCRSAMRP